jgi:hypothetical protein
MVRGYTSERSAWCIQDKLNKAEDQSRVDLTGSDLFSASASVSFDAAAGGGGDLTENETGFAWFLMWAHLALIALTCVPLMMGCMAGGSRALLPLYVLVAAWNGSSLDSVLRLSRSVRRHRPQRCWLWSWSLATSSRAA